MREQHGDVLKPRSLRITPYHSVSLLQVSPFVCDMIKVQPKQLKRCSGLLVMFLYVRVTKLQRC